jgi:hypothetical protein
MIKTSILTDNASLKRLFSDQKTASESPDHQASIAMQIRCYYATMQKNMQLSKHVLQKLTDTEQKRQSA